MNRTSKSILFFVIYSLLIGIVWLLFFNIVLPLFNLPVSGESWLNFLGFVLMCSAYYHIRSALSGNMKFALYTTHIRFTVLLVVVYLIATSKADWHFVSFGIVDGLDGLWTWFELKK